MVLILQRYAKQLRLLRLDSQEVVGELAQRPFLPVVEKLLAERSLLWSEGASHYGEQPDSSRPKEVSAAVTAALPCEASLTRADRNPESGPSAAERPLRETERTGDLQKAALPPQLVAVRRAGGSYTYAATDLAALMSR